MNSTSRYKSDRWLISVIILQNENKYYSGRVPYILFHPGFIILFRLRNLHNF